MYPALFVLADLAPEVGADLFDFSLLFPAPSNSLHYWRFVVSEAKGDQILLREILGQGIQIADIARLRINGVVMNTNLWYDFYDVNRRAFPAAEMTRNNDHRTVTWSYLRYK